MSSLFLRRAAALSANEHQAHLGWIMMRSIPQVSSFFSTNPKAASTVTDPMMAQPHQHAVIEEADLVKDAIRVMMEARKENEKKHDMHSITISDERLEQRFKTFQGLLKEARLCISDCKEAALAAGDEARTCSPSLPEEETSREDEREASNVVDECFEAYADLLDDLRFATKEQQEKYANIRVRSGTNLKLLRQELEHYISMSSTESE